MILLTLVVILFGPLNVNCYVVIVKGLEFQGKHAAPGTNI